MGLTDMWAQLKHIILWFFVPKEQKVEADNASIYLPQNKTALTTDIGIIKNLQDLAKKVTKDVEQEHKQILSEISPSQQLTKKERIDRITDLIYHQVMAQKYKDPETKELNLIHPDYARYILTLGAGMASEYTEYEIQQLSKKSGEDVSKKYAYEALSAQWRKSAAHMIEDNGKLLVDAKGQAKFLASLDELWRQTVWADPKFAADWLMLNKISSSEIYEYLLELANDSVEYLPSTDKPRTG